MNRRLGGERSYRRYDAETLGGHSAVGGDLPATPSQRHERAPASAVQRSAGSAAFDHGQLHFRTPQDAGEVSGRPADVAQRRSRSEGQGRRVEEVDGEERSPLVTVAGLAALFFCGTIVAAVALGVFCRKRNTVFPLETKSDDDDDDVDDDAADDRSDPGTVQTTSKNSHRHRHHRRRSTPEDSVSASVYVPDGSPQLAAAHQADTQQNDHHFRFADGPLPVASAHAHRDAAFGREATVQPEDLNEASFAVEQSETVGSPFSTASQIDNYSVAAASAAAASSPSTPSSSFFTFLSLMSSLHRRHVTRSLGHVLNSRWMRRRQRVPAAAVVATGDQSASSDAAHDHVDMTSLLPAL